MAQPSNFAGSPFAPRMTWDSSADAIAAIDEMLQLLNGAHAYRLVQFLFDMACRMRHFHMPLMNIC